MKIRDKLEVANMKAKERQREIEEGAKVAKVIDALRETKSNEEENLRKFREQSLLLIRQEIALKIAEKNMLMEDIASLRGVYNNLKEKVENINNRINIITNG